MYDCPDACHLLTPHAHCATCGLVMLAEGDGPVYAFDAPVIDGYEGGTRCSTCPDSMLCEGCRRLAGYRCPSCVEYDRERAAQHLDRTAMPVPGRIA